MILKVSLSSVDSVVCRCGLYSRLDAFPGRMAQMSKLDFAFVSYSSVCVRVAFCDCHVGLCVVTLLQFDFL